MLSRHRHGDERGVAGNVVNAPLAPGSGSDDFREAWEGQIIPALAAFSPELLLISAGFDAHAADPLAQLRLREADFKWVTEALLAVADSIARAGSSRCWKAGMIPNATGGFGRGSYARANAVIGAL